MYHVSFEDLLKIKLSSSFVISELFIPGNIVYFRQTSHIYECFCFCLANDLIWLGWNNKEPCK